MFEYVALQTYTPKIFAQVIGGISNLVHNVQTTIGVGENWQIFHSYVNEGSLYDLDYNIDYL